ncbi:hypothetical protein GCM10022204_45790 [Microlunatus aurantiacus]|uniref:Uncharacterized protein n=1 Tax=Microlunatus aurantiacus TaxID=446786 RepID=A0ABP7ENE5_9ACTN
MIDAMVDGVGRIALEARRVDAHAKFRRCRMASRATQMNPTVRIPAAVPIASFE